MENFFSSKSLLSLFLKWKWHLLIVAFAAAMVSFIITSPWIIKPKYKAVSVVYPSNIAPYSDESETEQMLQWINSKDVRDSVIDKLQLNEYYKISKKDPKYNSTIGGIYDKNIKVNKTQYESIEITVFDWDKEFAKRISNTIIEQTNQKIARIHFEKYNEVAVSYKKALDDKKSEIDSVKNLISELTVKTGVYNIGQAGEITRGVLGTVDGNGSAINHSEVKRLRAGIEEHVSDIIFLNFRMQGLADEYSMMARKYDLALFDAEKKFTYLNIVTPPEVGDKPAFPKKLLTMIYFIITAIVMSVIAIAVIERRDAFINK